MGIQLRCTRPPSPVAGWLAVFALEAFRSSPGPPNQNSAAGHPSEFLELESRYDRSTDRNQESIPRLHSPGRSSESTSSSDPSPAKKWEFRTGELGPLLLTTHELPFSQSRITSPKPRVTEFLLDPNERHKNTCISANSFKTHGEANFYSTQIDNSTRYKQRISGTIDRQIVAKATHSLAAICCAGESDIMTL